MRRPFRFLAALIFGLALVTWGASLAVRETTRRWVEKDLRLRALLAVNGTRNALVASWLSEKRGDLRSLLDEITRDERIMAAAACTADWKTLTRTNDFPRQFDCGRLHERFARGEGRTEGPGQILTSEAGGRLHISAVPIAADGRFLGFVVLVHDLTYAERRDAKTREFLLLAFGFLALAASAVTMIAARVSWRGWSEDLRRHLQGGKQAPEFQPLLRDVRDLVDRMVAEREADLEGGEWNAQRLKQTLSRQLQGEKVVIVANREPYIHEKTPGGKPKIVHPASGLVTALEPVVRACSGVWIGHASGSADRETADRNGRLRVPPGEESYSLRRIWLTREEELGYYYGFSNEGLWPLCHIAHARPVFRSEDWLHYQAANEKFADAVLEEVDADDPVVLVQDYHFALLPLMIRRRLPRATVIMFWHIPWPNSEFFGICPWSEEILEGMLGASILGFHTQFHCNNFVDSVDRLLEARIDREQNAVIRLGRSTLVRPYPISIAWPPPFSSRLPDAAECRASVLRELDLAPDALIGIGVDRLDYTKGIQERFLAVERLLESHPEFLGRFTFVQLAAPSRTVIERYRQLNEDVERSAARINERLGSGKYRPIVLLREHHERPTIERYYRAANLCYVSSLHDGMNLVAKEFVAAREDEGGALVLSQFTGAARELTEALIVNPYDLEEASEALASALRMSKSEQRDRMRSMRAFLAEFNVYRWAGRMLVDAARIRGRDRLTGRLTAHFPGEVARSR